MKQEISENEAKFVRDGFRKNFRSDGRANTDVQSFTTTLGSIEEAFGSATVTFGEADIQIVCAIKGEIQKPLPCEPNKGQVTFHLESSQTGTSLYTHEQDADMTKQRLLHILSTLYTDTVVDREELVIFKAEYVWQLHVDVLVMDELSLYQLDYIGASIRAAFQNLRLPQVIATLNANSNKIEVGLVEEIYPDKANTDALVLLPSVQDSPFIVSIGIMRDQQQDIVVLDVDAFEIQCVDQVLHLAVDSKMRVRGFVQSKGLNSRKQPCGLPASIFSSQNLRSVLSERMKQFMGSTNNEVLRAI